MSTAGALAWVAQAMTIALAIVLARRRPQHRPFAIWAAVVLGAELIRWRLNAGPLDAPRPYSGALRAIFHLDQLLLLLDPVGLAALACVVFLCRRPWIPLLAGLVVFAVLVLGYPHPFRGPVLGGAYAAIQGAAIAATVACLLSWGRWREHPRPEHAATLFAASVCVAGYWGPYAPKVGVLMGGHTIWLPEPWSDWNAAQLIVLCMWVGLLAMHIASLWTGWLEPAPPRGGLGTR